MTQPTGGSTRLKGNKLSLTFGSPGEDYWADQTSVVLDSEDGQGNTVTFYDAANPDESKQYFFTLSAIQSTLSTSFWRYLWENAGSDDIAFTYAPNGNAEASADQPHFVGTCKIPQRPKIGGDAGEDNTFTFDIRLDINGVPTLDDGSTG